jgi:hypothetical protein
VDSQQFQSPWKRIYFDVPRELDDAFGELAKRRGITKKALLAQIMGEACLQEKGKHGKGKGKAR